MKKLSAFVGLLVGLGVYFVAFAQTVQWFDWCYGTVKINVITDVVDCVDEDGPISGQIIVDPDHDEWLAYEGGGPFFLAGPGDPEGFLYRGTRNADGTRDGDQVTLINKLIGTGANSIYMQIVRSNGGDGGSTENPFEASDPTKDLDPDILNQWEEWFTLMDDNDIVIFLFFYDDSARIWLGDTVGVEEQNLIDGVVHHFAHHKNLIWVVAEEYSEAYTVTRVSNIAAAIRTADIHDHPIAVHQRNGVVFDFATDANIEQFAIQRNVATAQLLHDEMVTAWNNSAGRYNNNMSEALSFGTGATARAKEWAIAMGGAYVMVFEMDIASTAVADLEDLGNLRNFMESTNFNTMSPSDALAHGGTDYVLNGGTSYIAYSLSLVGDIGLKSMTSDDYDLKWIDIPSGDIVNETNVTVGAGDQTFTRPSGIGTELAVWIRPS